MATKANLDIEITRILQDFCIPANLLGFHYLIDIIKYSLNHQCASITKELYPHVAKTFDTTNSKVERAIRHAIEFGFDNCDTLTVQKYFGNTLRGKKPTNAHFIATIAHYLYLHVK